MNEKKKSDLSMWLVALACIVAFGAAVIYFVNNFELIKKAADHNLDPINTVLYDESLDEIPDGYYHISVDATMGNFATSMKDNEENEYYYVVWLDDGSVAALSVFAKSEKEALEEITDKTWAYVQSEDGSEQLTDTPLELDVKVSGLTGDTAVLYNQALEKWGINEDNMEIRQVILDAHEGGLIIHDSIFYGISGLIALAVGIFFLWAIHRTRNVEGKVTADSTEGNGSALVPYSQAKGRMTKGSKIAKNFGKVKRTAAIYGILTLALILIPVGIYVYDQNFDGSDAVIRKFDDADDMAQAKNGEAAEFVATEKPELLHSDDDGALYAIDQENGVFLVLMDTKDYDSVRKKLSSGKDVVIRGALDEPTSDMIRSAIRYLTGFESSDENFFEENFGKYVLRYQEGYRGSGVSGEDMENYAYLFGLFAVLCAVMFLGAFFNVRRFVNNLRFMSDGDFAMLERELESPTTKVYPQKCYLTDSFIAVLHSVSAYKDSSKTENDSIFLRYADIERTYTVIGEMYKKPVNCGVAVWGEKFGKRVLFALPYKEENMKICEEVMDLIVERGDNVMIGKGE